MSTTYHRTRTCSNSAEWILGRRSHIRYEMYLKVDNHYSKTFNNVVLVSKLSTLTTSHILLRCCQVILSRYCRYLLNLAVPTVFEQETVID